MRSWWSQTAGGLPKVFWYLWVGTLINRSGAFVMLFLEINMVAKYGFSASYAGLVLGLFGGGMAFGSLAGGVLADRWGRRATLLLSNAGLAVTAVTLGFAFDQVTVALLATAYGVWNGLGRPAFSATMVDVLGPEKRMAGMNLNYWAINLGFAAAAILAGVMARAPHLTVFLINAATQLLMAAIVLIKIPESRPAGAAVSLRALRKARRGAQAEATVGPARAKTGILAVLNDRVFMTFVLLNFGMWTVIESCKLLPIAMHQRGLDPADYGLIIAVNGVLIVVGQLFIPKLIANRERGRVLSLAGLLVGLGMGAVAIAGTVPALMLTVVLWTLGEMLNAPITGAYVADLSRADMRGRYQGVASMGFTLASFVAPVAGGLLLDHAPAPTLWLVLAGVGVIVAVFQLVSGPARDRRVRELREPAQAPARLITA